MITPLKMGLGIIALLFAVGIVVTAASSFESSTQSTPFVASPTTEESPTLQSMIEATVARVIDGDTIELSTGEKVRYIGIDTSETVDPRTAPQCFGKEASNKNKELVEGKMVTLEKDVSETDRYGRLLRYVYVEGRMINETLVAEGFAKSSSYPPDIKHQDKFREAEASARNSKIGLWSGTCDTPTNTPTPQATTQVTVTKTPIPVTSNAPTSAPTSSVNCSSNSYNCTDFSTCSEAEAVYNACSTDVHGLDRDEDGIPCDTLCQ